MLGLTLYDPFRAILPRRRLFSHVFGPSLLRELEAENGHLPARVDIAEDENGYTIKAELPGFSKEEVKIEVEGGRLHLRAEHEEEKEEKKENYHLQERVSGAYARTFTLPDNVEAEKIEAKMENGVLTLTLPKAEEAQPKQIEIKAK